MEAMCFLLHNNNGNMSSVVMSILWTINRRRHLAVCTKKKKKRTQVIRTLSAVRSSSIIIITRIYCNRFQVEMFYSIHNELHVVETRHVAMAPSLVEKDGSIILTKAHPLIISQNLKKIFKKRPPSHRLKKCIFFVHFNVIITIQCTRSHAFWSQVYT